MWGYPPPPPVPEYMSRYLTWRVRRARPVFDLRLKNSQTFNQQLFNIIFSLNRKVEDRSMSQKIPKKKLLDLYERSINCMMSPEQCAIWLPEVCEMALNLLNEIEQREKLIEMVQKVEQHKKAKKLKSR